MLNVFVLDDVLALVDLPGYGYAKLSHKKRTILKNMLFDYVQKRTALCGLVQLLDSRREKPSKEDRDFFDLAMRSKVLVLPLVNKIDLIPKNRRFHHVALIEKNMGMGKNAALACSAKTGEGLSEVKESLMALRK